MYSAVYRWTSPRISASAQQLLSQVNGSGQWSYGPVARTVERELAVRLGVAKTLLTNSGTSALWLLLNELRGRHDTPAIILPAFGYSAAANVAASLGFEVYAADCLPDAPLIDPASVTRLLDSKVVAVIGINYFGYAVAWDKMPRSKEYLLIEDAAGSFGAQYQLRPCGSQADAAILSFHTSKAAAAGGEGGCVASADETLMEALRVAARNGHRTGYYYAEATGMNMLMTDVAACFLQDTLAHFEADADRRQAIVSHLDQVCKRLGVEPYAFNHSSAGRLQNYQTYAALINNRDIVLELIRLNGIEARPCWPFLIDEQPATQQAVTKKDGDLTHARRFARHIINIPVNPSLPDALLDRLEVVMQQSAGIVPLALSEETEND